MKTKLFAAVLAVGISMTSLANAGSEHYRLAVISYARVLAIQARNYVIWFKVCGAGLDAMDARSPWLDRRWPEGQGSQMVLANARRTAQMIQDAAYRVGSLPGDRDGQSS